MEKNTKRCHIWIPLWRTAELEAWFAEMSLQGWELQEIEDKSAVFNRTEPKERRYHCMIYEPYKRKKGTSYNEELKLDKESRKNQREAITQAGWQNVTENDYIAIFSSQGPLDYPVEPKQRLQEIISLYKRTTRKLMIPWVSLWMLFSCFLIAITIRIGIGFRDLLLSPFLHIILFLLLYSILKIPFLLVWRQYRVKMLRRYYAGHLLELSAEGDYITAKRRQIPVIIVKWATVGIILLFFILPVANYYAQSIIEGKYPPIPNKGVSILRLSDINPAFETAAEDYGNSHNFCRSYPTLLYPVHRTLFEYDTGYEFMFQEYKAISPWLAEMIYQTDFLLEDLCNQKIDKPEQYGFDEIWVGIIDHRKNEFFITAINGSTIYIVECQNVTNSWEDVIKIMKDKLNS